MKIRDVSLFVTDNDVTLICRVTKNGLFRTSLSFLCLKTDSFRMKNKGRKAENQTKDNFGNVTP